MDMDRKLVSLLQSYEVRYVSKKKDCTLQDVEAAVKAVGHSREKVYKWLDDKAVNEAKNSGGEAPINEIS